MSIAEPSQRLEGDETGMPYDHESLESTGRAVIAARSSLTSDAVVDDQVSAVDVEL